MNEIFEVLVGTFLGIVTGVIPGLHVNLLVPLFPNSLILLGTAISHTFFDFIPSLVLGVPDESSAVASLPGHRLVLRGEGQKAFLLSVIGGFVSSLVLIVILPALLIVNHVTWIIPTLLLVSLVLLVLSHRKPSLAILVLFMSVILTFVSNPFSGHNLVAYFTGLFGVPTLFFAVISGAHLPKQKPTSEINVKLNVALFSALGGTLAGILPGITSSVSAVSMDSFLALSDEDKVTLVGGINTVYVMTSFLAIWLIGKPRSGVAIALQDYGISLIPCLFMAVSLSMILALLLGPKIFNFVSSIVNRWTNLLVLLLLVVFVNFLFSDSLPLFLASASLGLICYALRVKRTVGLGYIIFPIILNYL